MDILNNKIIFAFNKISLSFVKELKKQSEFLKAIIKKNYRLYDKKSPDYVVKFKKALENTHASWFSETNALDDSNITNAEVFKDIRIQTMLEKCDEENHLMISTYLHILFILSYMYDTSMPEEEASLLFDKIIRVIYTMQNDEESIIEDVLDDDIETILGKIQTLNKQSKVIMSETPKTMENQPMPDFLKNTKIGSLAEEIASGFDPSNVENMMGGDLNNMLPDMIQKVSSAITQKMSSGELTQEDLVNESTNMMQFLSAGMGSQGNAGMASFMSEMMGSMGGMGDMMGALGGMLGGDTNPRKGGLGTGPGGRNRTKERLRKRAEEKKLLELKN